ncbi:uncharacterized protein TNCV_81091 [Trichonephila clavipes]|nr:uncharacterized protein TNCV_81091 [Trichonephila clavipes]
MCACDEEKSDDVKVKLLSHWNPKYQRLMQLPPPPKPFEIPKELSQETEVEQEQTLPPMISMTNMIIYCMYYSKIEKEIHHTHFDVNYTFNEMNELQKDGKTEYRSNGIDLFSYLMRNERDNRNPPLGFQTFFQGISNANIPIEWIGNKNMKELMFLSQADPK